jgi:FixJ family two-component response regulator
MSAGDAMIFVVDDDASRRDVLPWFLRSVGLQITTFASAREFLHHRGADVPGCKVKAMPPPTVITTRLGSLLGSLASWLFWGGMVRIRSGSEPGTPVSWSRVALMG